MLDQIIASKKQEVETLSLRTQREKVINYSFVDALKRPNHSIALIAEIKRASPSKGVINDQIDPANIARAYEEAGADAISVLTDQPFFQGSLTDLIKVKHAAQLPVLRKDFIIDEQQILESASAGADAILLIVKALGVEKTHEFYQLAKEQGLDCLVEVHGKSELIDLLNLFAPEVIGVNNRNLATFHTSLHETENMRALIPDHVTFISESGIHTGEDIQRVKQYGANGVLVGEALMKAPTPTIGVKQLFSKERIETNED